MWTDDFGKRSLITTHFSSWYITLEAGKEAGEVVYAPRPSRPRKVVLRAGSD